MPSPSTRASSSPTPRQNTGCVPRHVDWSVEPACRRKSGRASISRSRPTRAGKRSGLGARSYRALARRSARALPPGPPEHIDGDKPNALWRASKDVGSKRLAAWRSRASQSSTEARGFLRLEKVTLTAGDIVTRPSRELRAARASPRRRCRQSRWSPPRAHAGPPCPGRRAPWRKRESPWTRRPLGRREPRGRAAAGQRGGGPASRPVAEARRAEPDRRGH